MSLSIQSSLSWFKNFTISFCHHFRLSSWCHQSIYISWRHIVTIHYLNQNFDYWYYFLDHHYFALKILWIIIIKWYILLWWCIESLFFVLFAHDDGTSWWWINWIMIYFWYIWFRHIWLLTLLLLNISSITFWYFFHFHIFIISYFDDLLLRISLIFNLLSYIFSFLILPFLCRLISGIQLFSSQFIQHQITFHWDKILSRFFYIDFLIFTSIHSTQFFFFNLIFCLIISHHNSTSKGIQSN